MFNAHKTRNSEEIFAYGDVVDRQIAPESTGLRMMPSDKKGVALSVCEIEAIVLEAYKLAGLELQQAELVAKRIAATEADGIPTHGLALALRGLGMVSIGKVTQHARPRIISSGPGFVQVDCDGGYPDLGRAIGSEAAWKVARTNGVAALSLVNAYSGGALGYHAEILSAGQFIVLGFAGAPAAMAPWQGRAAVLGTSPLALVVPAAGQTLVLVDQAATTVAKGTISAHAKSGEMLSEGWAFDSTGKPTIVAAEALRGTLAPAGGAKGYGLALIVEVFAAMLGGPNLAHDAPSLLDKLTGSPRLGSFFFLVDPAAFDKEAFETRLRRLATLIGNDEGGRLPGERRLLARKQSAHDGVFVDPSLLKTLQEWRPE